MKIHKLLLGILCTSVLVVLVPIAFARIGWIQPLVSKSWLVLLITGGGLVLKALVGDVASGEFLWHKYGYDNCILSFGSALTAVVLQLSSKTDLFPGLSSVSPLNFSAFTQNPVAAREIQLFVFFFVALIATLLTARISNAIREHGTLGKDYLALTNAVVGVILLSIFVMILVSKG
jgi:hypothetical protein